MAAIYQPETKKGETTMTPLLAIMTGVLMDLASVPGQPVPSRAPDCRPIAARSCAMLITPTLANQTEEAMTQGTVADPAQPHPYVGMWVTEDGRIRQELLPNGRYDEARGTRQSAYVGRYKITGTSIFYWDDSGFTADGEFVDINTLNHGGMIFVREQ
jgi:hypothetical protein